MRILLDENVPRRLKYRLEPEHEVFTVQDRGWSGIQNGALLSKAEDDFDVLLTLDRNLEYQQDLTGNQLSVVVLKAKSSTYRQIQPLISDIFKTLDSIEPGSVIHVSG